MRLITPLPCDCVERLPHPDHPSILAIGTYLLDKDAGTKRGELLIAKRGLKRVDGAEGAEEEAKTALAIESGAIFDAQWMPTSLWSGPALPLIASVTSNCGVDIHELEIGSTEEGEPVKLRSSLRAVLTEADDEDEAREASALAVCWLNAETTSTSAVGSSRHLDFAVSRSDGKITTCSLDLPSSPSSASASSSSPALPSSSLRVTNTWKAHSYGGAGGPPAEVWCVAAPPASSSCLWSGADDALLKIWDLRALPRAQLTCKGHEAGVCAIAFHPHREHLVATGSYDQHLRLWDARKMTKEPLASFDAGGGVWKLKWHPKRPKHPKGEFFLAAACMYAGAQVFKVGTALEMETAGEVDGENMTVERSRHYEGHKDQDAGNGGGAGVDSEAVRALGGTNTEPLVYGIEWLDDDDDGDGGDAELATCAFYHRSVHSWKL